MVHELQGSRPQAPLLRDDGHWLLLGREQHGGHPGRRHGGHPSNHLVVDHARATGHGGYQPQGIGTIGRGQARLVDISDTADLDAHAIGHGDLPRTRVGERGTEQQSW